MSSTGMMAGMHSGVEPSSNTQVIWGTNINQTDIQMRMQNFINTFVLLDENEENFTKAPHYIEQLKVIQDTEQYILEIDCDHIYQYDQLLYKQLENYPSDVIPMFDLVATRCYKEHFSSANQNMSSLAERVAASGGSSGMGMEMADAEEENSKIIQIRLFNMRKLYQIRELDPSHIDKLITIKGIVIRNSDVIPEMKEACFKCYKCFQTESVYVVMGKIQEPDACKNCKTRQSFQLIHNMSMFSDKQHVKLQETPESVPEGETPQTIHLCAYEDLVDYVKPGDRVEVIGIYKA
jgi:DNA replication licensing factor MCM4